MPLRTILFSSVFICFAFGAFFTPLFGILGYVAHYIIGAEKQWWHAPLNPLGIRYSLSFAVLTAVGIMLHRNKLKFKKLLVRQEVLALIMLLLLWMLYFINPETVGRYVATDHPTIKITKAMIFCLMMTHVITRPKDLDKLMWLFVVGSLLLGMQAYGLPRSAFMGGRLDAVVGGSDFLDANALAAFMVAASVIAGTVFMRASWRGKLPCAATGAFSLNTIVLCRSRGAFLALFGAGIAIVFMSPRHIRGKLIVGMVVGALGMLYLSDPQFLERVAKISEHAAAIAEGGESRDRSTMMRIEAWRGGIQMFRDHPLGVGPGNFNQYIGRYAPTVEGLSPHNIYIQTLAELGFPGMLVLLGLLGNGLWTVRNVVRISDRLSEPERSILQWSSCGLGAIIVSYATSGLTANILYFEGFWWFLLLPVCLQRASENAHEALLATTHETPAVETVA